MTRFPEWVGLEENAPGSAEEVGVSSSVAGAFTGRLLGIYFFQLLCNFNSFTWFFFIKIVEDAGMEQTGGTGSRRPPAQ